MDDKRHDETEFSDETLMFGLLCSLLLMMETGRCCSI